MKTPMNVFNTAMKKKNKNRKGFSLVELIVCLVIMAILAAALVPTLIGYIKQTRQSNAKNEAAACVSAAQAIASSAYADPNGKYHSNSLNKDYTITNGSVTMTDGDDLDAIVVDLAEVKGGDLKQLVITDGKVTKCVYSDKNSVTVTYETNSSGVGTYTVGGTTS